MKPSEAPVGTVATLGHPGNGIFIVKRHDGSWRYVESGALVDEDDFRGAWNLYYPEGTSVDIQDRCENMRQHMRSPDSCACHPHLPQPCDKCYSLIVTSVRIPYEPSRKVQ